MKIDNFRNKGAKGKPNLLDIYKPLAYIGNHDT